jgi:hypothetical protein
MYMAVTSVCHHANIVCATLSFELSSTTSSTSLQKAYRAMMARRRDGDINIKL